LASIDLCWINFLIEKILLKPILDAVNREKESKRTLQKMQRKEMQNLQADNQRIYKKPE
jgi:hypothetical protein